LLEVQKPIFQKINLKFKLFKKSTLKINYGKVLPKISLKHITKLTQSNRNKPKT